MQNSLWKLGALLGVVGVGFLVLLKAQNDMTRQAAGPEEFTERSAIEDLENLGSDPSSEPAGQTSLADTYGDEAAPTKAQPTDGNKTASAGDPTSATAKSPVPARTSAVELMEGDANPFSAFGFDEPAVATDKKASVENDVQPTAAVASGNESETSGSATGEVNPFAQLVSSLTSEAADKLAQVEESVKSELDDAAAKIETTVEAEADDLQSQLSEAADRFDPFAPVAEESAEPTQAVETAAAEPTEVEPAALEPTEAEPAAVVASDVRGPTESESPYDPDVISVPAPKQFEPTSLTALPPSGAGPALMAPTEQGEEPAVESEVETAALEAESDEADQAIAQVSGEQSAGAASDPNPFLVLPGADEPAPVRQDLASETPALLPQFPSDEPSASNEQAPLGADFPEDNSENRVVLPDGTVEMTIPSRAQTADAGGFNPFAADPEPAQQPQPERTQLPRAEPAPFGIGQSEPSLQGQPLLPGLEPATTAGPIQPSAAELRSGTRDHALTPADYVGVGTISPDTPSTPQQAQLTIEKHAPPDASLGQELIYSILITNVGRSTARNVVVEDLVPKGSELQGTDPQAQMTQDKRLVWQLGAMEPGQKRTIRIKVIPTEAGQIGSVATVSFEAAVASRTVITAPQVRLDMKAPPEVRVGEKVPLRFTLINDGTADASNVYLRNIVPPGFEHPAAERQPSGEIDIEYEVGTLPRGQSRDVELTLLAVEPGKYENHAILTADGNVSVEARQPVNVITSRVTIRREGPAQRIVGSQALFVNTVSNESSQMVNAIRITETIPQGMKFLQASDNGYHNEAQRTVTWQINTLEPGGRRRLQISLLAEESGQLASTVTAIDQSGDKAEAKSQLDVTGFSSLTIDVDNPARAIPVGQEVALRVKIRNGGSATANQVQTRIELPPQLRFVSARGPVRYAQEGNYVAFEPIDQIGIEGEQTFDIVLAGASESRDARVVVQLESNELSKPLSEDESVVIYAD